MTTESIREKLKNNEIPFPEDLPEKLSVYLGLLQEWNARIDLTAVLSDEEMVDRHFMDSLSVLRTGLIPRGASLIDVGTGAGFPGMILAIARPDLSVTLLDAQQKRLNFLSEVREKTAAANTKILHGRAEDCAKNREYREKFDIAAARAVAPLNVLAEYLVPFVRIGGCALCWKGPSLQSELEAGSRAVKLLGGRLEMPVHCSVFGRDWEHRILPIRKTEKTAAVYPRKAGLPKVKPLGGTNER